MRRGWLAGLGIALCAAIVLGLVLTNQRIHLPSPEELVDVTRKSIDHHAKWAEFQHRVLSHPEVIPQRTEIHFVTARWFPRGELIEMRIFDPVSGHGGTFRYRDDGGVSWAYSTPDGGWHEATLTEEEVGMEIARGMAERRSRERR